jgi:hypothetical protein
VRATCRTLALPGARTSGSVTQQTHAEEINGFDEYPGATWISEMGVV